MERLLREFWPILVPTLLGFAAVYLLLPKVRASKAAWGVLAGGAALALMVWQFGTTRAAWQERALFLTFAAIALTGGVMLVTQKNPAHAALSFTLVIIATCGIFLLNGAPFLMAATIIIYAGAIVVTFLFVIMLAAQAGLSDADGRSREPFLSCLAGFILLGAILCVIQRSFDQRAAQALLADLRQVAQAQNLEEAYAALGGQYDRDNNPSLGKWVNKHKGILTYLIEDEEAVILPHETVLLNLEGAWSQGDLKEMKRNSALLLDSLQPTGSLYLTPSQTGKVAQSPFTGAPPTREEVDPDTGKVKDARTVQPRTDPETGRYRERLPAANVEALGRSLFTDYLVPFLAAGVLLLVATIGAIAIAGRRGEVLK